MIKKAEKRDLEIISDIYEAEHDLEEKGLISTGWIRGVYPSKETAETAIENGVMFVCEKDGVLGACAKIDEDEPEVYKKAKWRFSGKTMVLHTLVCDPRLQGKGFAKELVNFYEELAIKNRCECLRMDTNVKNIQARNMYKHLGFSEAGEVDCVFNGIPGMRLVFLEKKL